MTPELVRQQRSEDEEEEGASQKRVEKTTSTKTTQTLRMKLHQRMKKRNRMGSEKGLCGLLLAVEEWAAAEEDGQEQNFPVEGAEVAD